MDSPLGAPPGTPESFVFIHHLDSFEEYRCEGDIRIDGETEVFVTYSGGKIDSLCYVMGIMGRDAQNLKRYRLCLETLVYSDPDCELLVGLISSDPQVHVFIVEMTLITYIMGGGGGGLVLVVLLITGIKIYRSRQQTPAQNNTGETGECEGTMETYL
uniref:Uncharacterized protein n=1 Tax=Magallana gigas TaxID=29159 RepID=K1RMJ1_MAGGI